MISNPKFGWCNFNIGNFYGHPSYLTDVPVDLINFFLDAKKGESECFFDEEGTEFTLISNKKGISIIASREEDKLYEFPNYSINQLAKECYQDILNDFDNWVTSFVISDEKEDIENHRKEIEKLLNKMKKEYKIERDKEK